MYSNACGKANSAEGQQGDRKCIRRKTKNLKPQLWWFLLWSSDSKRVWKKNYWKASIISWNIWKKLIHWSGIFCPVHSKNYGCLGKQNVIILLYEITPHRKVLSGMELDPMTQKEKCYVAKSYVDCITTIMWKQRKSAAPQNWN